MATNVTNQKTSSTYLPLLFNATRSAVSGRSLGVRKLKLDILLTGFKHRDLLRQITDANEKSTVRRYLNKRPAALGLLVWPYQSADWNSRTRLERFQAHYDAVDSLGSPLDFLPDQKIVLADMGDIYPELKLVLDQPLWMMREGGLTINLFIGTFRAFSLTFSFFQNASGALEVLIGGCQGRDVDNILDTYRALTKAAHGLRPRDLLLECFGSFCRSVGVGKIRAVSDANRHRRHPFFKHTDAFKQSYDAVWTERGGSLADDGFYELPVSPARKDLSEIKAKKRSMYRKRFEFLDDLENRIATNLKTATPICFQET